jgi:hypothetical protein
MGRSGERGVADRGEGAEPTGEPADAWGQPLGVPVSADDLMAVLEVEVWMPLPRRRGGTRAALVLVSVSASARDHGCGPERRDPTSLRRDNARLRRGAFTPPYPGAVHDLIDGRRCFMVRRQPSVGPCYHYSTRLHKGVSAVDGVKGALETPRRGCTCGRGEGVGGAGQPSGSFSVGPEAFKAVTLCRCAEHGRGR